MKDLVIGDVHFGVRANSINWLEWEINLFNYQIIPAITEHNVDRIIFLGDLFDIRYAVNQQVAIEVKNIMRKLSETAGKREIIFIAGNHDYYSQLEEHVAYNAYQVVFGEEFIKCHPNITIVDKEPYFSNGALFLPWYYTENTDHFDEILYRYDFHSDVKCIYCHADLGIWPGPRIASLKGVPIYSGHIHNVTEYMWGNLHNVGSVLPLTFNDVNEERYFYVITDYAITERIKNETTPMFKRIYNEDIFHITAYDLDNAYMQLCISESNMTKARYIDKIKELKTSYTDAYIRVHIIDDDVKIENVDSYSGVFNTNVSNYIETNIPEHLSKKYEIIKERIQEQ